VFLAERTERTKKTEKHSTRSEKRISGSLLLLETNSLEIASKSPRDNLGAKQPRKRGESRRILPDSQPLSVFPVAGCGNARAGDHDEGEEWQRLSGGSFRDSSMDVMRVGSGCLQKFARTLDRKVCESFGKVSRSARVFFLTPFPKMFPREALEKPRSSSSSSAAAAAASSSIINRRRAKSRREKRLFASRKLRQLISPRRPFFRQMDRRERGGNPSFSLV